MPFKDFYIVLGIRPNSPLNDIKKSYRKLVLKYHPDRNPGNLNTIEKFREIQEAYEILSDPKAKMTYDSKYKEHYEPGATKTSDGKENSAFESFTPEVILRYFRKIEISLVGVEFKNINQDILYKNLSQLLDDKTIEFLHEYGDIEINNQIINVVLGCLNSAKFPNVEKLCVRLAKLAGSDNGKIEKIRAYVKERSLLYNLKNYAILAAFVLLIGYAFFSIYSSNNKRSSESDIQNPSMGNTYSSPKTDSTSKPNSTSSMSDPVLRAYALSSLKKEDYSGWKEMNYKTGDIPGCSRSRQIFDYEINNRLEITVGPNTNAVIKIIDTRTRKSIRSVFIQAGSKFVMRHIPEGRYSLKIAYGWNWMENEVNGKCVAKFTQNAIYKRSKEIFDFNKIEEGERTEGDSVYKNYSIPSYFLKLDVVTSDSSETFKSDLISEEKFLEE
jgi:curved DNA-binding protein CbpA